MSVLYKRKSFYEVEYTRTIPVDCPPPRDTTYNPKTGEGGDYDSTLPAPPIIYIDGDGFYRPGDSERYQGISYDPYNPPIIIAIDPSGGPSSLVPTGY